MERKRHERKRKRKRKRKKVFMANRTIRYGEEHRNQQHEWEAPDKIGF